MLIKKDFTQFQDLIKDKEKRELLFKSKSWFVSLYLQTSPWHETIIQKDNIIIPFIVSDYIYKMEFSRSEKENYIQVVNSSMGAMWWYFANYYLSKRLMKNWNKVADELERTDEQLKQ